MQHPRLRFRPKVVASRAAIALVVAGYASMAAATTCSSSTSCSAYVNTSTGPAIHGEGSSGPGVRGTSISNTGFFGSSASGSVFYPGVEGESTNQNGADVAGGFGLNYLAGGAAPAYGVVAAGSIHGVVGEGTSSGSSSDVKSFGVWGKDQGGTGYPNYNVGVLGTSASGIGMLAEANASRNVIYGTEPIGLFAVSNDDGMGVGGAIAIYAESDTIPLQIYNTTDSSQTITFGQGRDMINASANGGEFDVDNSGDGTFSGTVSTTRGTYSRTQGATGKPRISYGERTTRPVLEDFGEARLIGGSAVVKIDPLLANVIDRRIAYHVFLKPEGECNGLYIARKAAGEFEVRELHAGRASLDFEYRIVAKPFDDDGERLALAPALPAGPRGLPRSRSTKNSGPLTAEDRLKNRLGPARYASALKRWQQQLATETR